MNSRRVLRREPFRDDRIRDRICRPAVFEYGPRAGHYPSHEIRQLAVGLLRLAAECLRGPGPFPPPPRPQAQPFKKGGGDDADGPAAGIPAFVTMASRLGPLHEAGLFELPDGPLAPTLPQAGIADAAFHADVDEPVGQGLTRATPRTKFTRVVFPGPRGLT